MRHASLIALLILVAGLIAGCQTSSGSLQPEMAEENVSLMTGAEIEQALKGNTLRRTGSTAGMEWQWAGHYRPDGTMSARAWWNTGERVAEGRWSIEGNRFCREWENNWGGGDQGCFRIYRQGDRLTMIKVSGSGDEEGRSYLITGNPYDV